MDAIKTAARTFEVFEYFQEVQRPLQQKDFVDRFGYPASSTSALLKSLVILGYLEYNLSGRTYFPTMRMTSVVDWIERARFGNGSVMAAMKRLHEATAETVTLGLQSDLHAQYVYQIASKLSVPYPRTRQTIRPLAASGLGWLLLSAMPDSAVQHLVRRINYDSRRSKNRVNEEELFTRIKQIRKAGYVFSKHTVVRGAGMMGMLIQSPRSGRQLALSVHGPVDRLEFKQDLILKQLAAVCSAVSALDTGPSVAEPWLEKGLSSAV